MDLEPKEQKDIRSEASEKRTWHTPVLTRIDLSQTLYFKTSSD
jgi:hypothetical protein